MTQLLKCLIPTIGSPRTLNGKEGRYELAAFYCELLGMKIVNEPWLLIADGSDSGFYIGFDGDGWNEQRPPRWPDPDWPQQMHLDVDVPDVVAAGERATDLGASLLQDNGEFRVFADPVGHPFCLYSNASTDRPAVSRLVFDCFSPRSLASFYEGFLEARGRVDDSAERVVVDLGGDLPDLAFQHAQFRAARWPDPAYPAQLHVDYRWHDSLTARYALKRAESLGAIRLPQVPGAEIYADPASHPFCIQNEIPEVFEIAGLYLNPPEYAVVYSVDETGQGLPRAHRQPAQSTPGMLGTARRRRPARSVWPAWRPGCHRRGRGRFARPHHRVPSVSDPGRRQRAVPLRREPCLRLGGHPREPRHPELAGRASPLPGPRQPARGQMERAGSTLVRLYHRRTHPPWTRRRRARPPGRHSILGPGEEPRLQAICMDLDDRPGSVRTISDRSARGRRTIA